MLNIKVEIHKDTGEKSDEEQEEKVIEPEQPSIDETGRILFRKQALKKDTSKRDLQSIIDQEKDEPLKKKKKKQKVSLLSFEDNDE